MRGLRGSVLMATDDTDQLRRDLSHAQAEASKYRDALLDLRGMVNDPDAVRRIDVALGWTIEDREE